MHHSAITSYMLALYNVTLRFCLAFRYVKKLVEHILGVVSVSSDAVDGLVEILAIERSLMLGCARVATLAGNMGLEPGVEVDVLSDYAAKSTASLRRVKNACGTNLFNDIIDSEHKNLRVRASRNLLLTQKIVNDCGLVGKILSVRLVVGCNRGHYKSSSVLSGASCLQPASVSREVQKE